MISRKVKLIKRKVRYSDLLLDEKELRLIRFIETQTWMCELTTTITKRKLLEKDIFWYRTVEFLEHKGRLKNVKIYKTKVSFELVK